MPDDATGQDPGTPGTPRWVKVSAAVVLVVVALAVVLLVAGRGDHGPGRHAPSGGDAPSGETRDHTPPSGAHTEP